MSENIKDPNDNPKGNDVWEKKSERFEVRLPFSKKQAFLEACEGQGDTPSEAIRRFIHIYLKRSQEDSLDLARRTLKHKRRQKLGFGLTGILAIGVMSIAGPQGCASIKSQQFEAKRHSLFALYDKDGNGELGLGEIAPKDHSLHSVLDVDDSKTLSYQEFIVKGRMQVIDSQRGEEKPSYVPHGRRRLVEFDLTNPDNIILNAWMVDPEGGAINDKMDRLVYRHYKTGKFTGLLADTMLSFDGAKNGAFESITIDWTKTKETYGFGLEKLSRVKLEGDPEVEFDEDGQINFTADKVTVKEQD